MLKRNVVFCLITCLAAINPLRADEHAACTATAYDWFGHTANELRRVAATCKSRRFSELNYHRAYYRDLVTEGEATSSLINYARSESRLNFKAYTFHMVLTEQLAQHYFPDTAGQLRFLISEYEVNNEIAELRLRGYSNLAARLSRLHTKRDLPE